MILEKCSSTFTFIHEAVFSFSKKLNISLALSYSYNVELNQTNTIKIFVKYKFVYHRSSSRLALINNVVNSILLISRPTSLSLSPIHSSYSFCLFIPLSYFGIMRSSFISLRLISWCRLSGDSGEMSPVWATHVAVATNDPFLPLARRFDVNTEIEPDMEARPTATDIYHILGRRKCYIFSRFWARVNIYQILHYRAVFSTFFLNRKFTLARISAQFKSASSIRDGIFMTLMKYTPIHTPDAFSRIAISDIQFCVLRRISRFLVLVTLTRWFIHAMMIYLFRWYPHQSAEPENRLNCPENRSETVRRQHAVHISMIQYPLRWNVSIWRKTLYVI